MWQSDVRYIPQFVVVSCLAHSSLISRMGTRQVKHPPVLSEADDSLSWKNDINTWQMLTDLSKKKQWLAMYQAMKGRATEAVN